MNLGQALRVVILITNVATAGSLWAHADEHIDMEGWWLAWTLPPAIVVNLTLMAILYLIGFRRLHHSSSKSRQDRFSNTKSSKWRATSFSGALIVLLIALGSPIDFISARLGWVHMIQHSMLMMIAAPLFMLGNPGRVFIAGLPRRTQRQIWRVRKRAVTWQIPLRWLRHPTVIWTMYALTLWLWHLPTLYEAALDHPLIHDFQHLTFFAASCLFWKSVLHPLKTRRMEPAIAVIYLYLASIHSVALGVLMAISPFVWYQPYQKTATEFGIQPLFDQQLAGYIMWMPACMMYAFIALLIFGIWLRDLSLGKVQKAIN